MTELIVNADDFGLNSMTNDAITGLFKKGMINSTTIMANMPCFDEAVELAFKNSFENKIGIHLTLADGLPLTQNIKSIDFLNSANHIHPEKLRKHLFFLSKHEKIAIYNEFAAQIEKVKMTGIEVTHIDSHHHIHEIWPIAHMVLELLKKYNIAKMRILNNLNRSTSFYKTFYRNILNRQIRMQGAEFTDFFGNQLEAISGFNMAPSVFEDRKIEIMVHPDFNKKGIIIDKIKGREYDLEDSEDLKRLMSLYNKVL